MSYGEHARAGALAAVVALASACGPPADEAIFENPNGPVAWQPGAWSVVWHDEFDGPAGTAPDPTRWAHEIGGGGWGNKELQYYTDRTENAPLDGEGNLIITARAETFDTNAYTSARLRTKGLFSQTYGRFEARMRLADGQGLWPAFWIMGDDFDQVGWPYAGEIDILEQRGSDVHTVSSAVHGPGLPSGKDISAARSTRVTDSVATTFHVYAVEWDPASIVFLVDDVPFFQITPKRRPSYAPWVWDHPFFIIVNMAVGGLFPGDPNETTVFPASIAVDYVRVSVRQGDDGGVPDGGVSDAVGAGEPDAGEPDAGEPDAGEPDTGDLDVAAD
jgi:beta-glucanase (GH16 family)